MQPRTPQGRIPPFGLRLQPHMRNWLATRAEANGRSMNSELLAIIKIMMSAEPGRVRIRQQSGFYIVDGGESTEVEIFIDHKDAMKFARKKLKEIGLTFEDLEDMTAESN